MTDNTAGQAEHSLWTDEQHDAYALGMQTEREHQEALAKLAARKHEEQLAAAQARIAELEAQLAERGEWEPVPDGEYDMGLIDEPLYIFGNTDPDVCTHIEFANEEIMLDLGMTICRRVQREDEWS